MVVNASPEVLAPESLDLRFSVFESLCDGAMAGAVAVDRDCRITWINEAYARLIGQTGTAACLGRPIGELIPHTLMWQVIETGEPILIDIMKFRQKRFIVSRFPLRDTHGGIIGAIAFILFDQVTSLKPLMRKFAAMQDELDSVRSALAAERRTRYTFSHFVGTSQAVMSLKEKGRRAAVTDSPVLILGETGTGKELLAQAIHAASLRAERPFISVNVATIPETLLEAEFFGVAPGAYTGADRKGRTGKFQLAHGGTLFLDEIGEMPPQLQAKLLRALQEGEVERVGSNKLEKVDVRIIAATHRDLSAMVRERQFRADFFYRLNVVSLTIPPLRERSADLPALCERLLEQISARLGVSMAVLDADVLTQFAAYPWPGNVRELMNILEQAMAFSDSARLTLADVSPLLPELPSSLASSPSALQPVQTPDTYALDAVVAQAERQAILRAMRRADGNKVKAARLLGISRAKLYDRLAAYGADGELM